MQDNHPPHYQQRGTRICATMPNALEKPKIGKAEFADQVLRGLQFVLPFIHDILVDILKAQEYTFHLKSISERLNHYGFTINTANCVFDASSTNLLGHRINKDGIRQL
ncbi:hypothetical protein PHET_08555 [Paragonimus heterotremus]|uniref:Uncharacterized protein n=1 Tax=Paragonimus heterotremus TaxID=100268 RepID=A0A8J4SW70_9TREM|nr:hypothetical protein PHET_08555 [Paragonimus heterotremus]